MNDADQKYFAQLRPEKFDDTLFQQQIQLIQQICNDVSLDQIAVVFDECNYNIQHTIARIKSGDFEDAGWKTARSNHKKKQTIVNTSDQTQIGAVQCDNEQFFSHSTFPTSSRLHRNVTRPARQYFSSHRPPFMNSRRRGNNQNRSHFIPYNPHQSYRNSSNNSNKTANSKALSNQENSKELISVTTDEHFSSKQPQSPLTDGFELIVPGTQSLTFGDRMTTKQLPSSRGHHKPSSIPKEPVVMHPTIPSCAVPFDIQFGDVQLNDLVSGVVASSEFSDLTKSLDDEALLTYNEHYNTNIDVQSDVSTNCAKHQTINEMNRHLLLTTNRLSSPPLPSSSLPVTDNTLLSTLSSVSLEHEPSHLSDQLTNALSQQDATMQMISSSPLMNRTSLHATPASNTVQYITSTSLKNDPFTSNTLHTSSSMNSSNRPDENSSAFMPYTTTGFYPSTTRDYVPQTSTSSSSFTHKNSSKPLMNQPGGHSQQTAYSNLYPSQFYVGQYYPSPPFYSIVPIDSSWSTGGYEPYTTHPGNNYMPTYAPQSQYHHASNVQSNKHDRYSYDLGFIANYGQTRSLNNDGFNASQAAKDGSMSNKLPTNATSFSQGASYAPSNAAAAAATMYPNMLQFQYHPYYTTPPDRTMTYAASMDNRDNRAGASHSGSNNRNHYPQQRTYNNLFWHTQQ